MDIETIRNVITAQLDLIDIMYIEDTHINHIISCKGTQDEVGTVLHMLYTHNLNDVTKVQVCDDNVGDRDEDLFFDIIITA